jgi:hypothetical protein
MEELTAHGGLAAAISKIEEMAGKAGTVDVIEGHEPDGSYYLVKPGGTVEKVLPEPGWHKENLADPAELESFIRQHPHKDGEVYYNEQRVTYVFDFNDRRDQAVCELRPSEVWTWLTAGSKTLYGQAEFVRLLRITLRGCLADGSRLLDLVRSIKFTGQSEAAGVIKHGQESLGRSINQLVTGETALPEELVLDVQVFENFDRHAKVQCAIEIFPAEQRFKITPYPLELKKVMDRTMEELATVFDGVPSFWGEIKS